MHVHSSSVRGHVKSRGKEWKQQITKDFALYLTQVHDNTLMNFLPQVSSEDLNQWDFQCWNLAVHEDSCQVKLNLETNVNLEKKETKLRDPQLPEVVHSEATI